MTRSSCVCDMGWTGPECEAELGGCVSTPCAHGGTCHPQSSGYNCTCPTGYTGEVLPNPHTPWADHLLNQGQDQWRHASKGSGSFWSPPRRTGHGLQGTSYMREVARKEKRLDGRTGMRMRKGKGRESEEREKRRAPFLRPPHFRQGPPAARR